MVLIERIWSKLKKKLIDKIFAELLRKERYSYFDIKDLCEKVLPGLSYRKLKKFWREICE